MATAPSAAAVETDVLYEVIHGEIREVAPMGVYETWIASVLIQNLVGERKLGRAVIETLFDFTKTVGAKRRPDLAFVSYQRWPRAKPVPRTEAWDVVPDLAVEVVSPTNAADDVLGKLTEYFQVGVERVWVIYPSQRQIYVYSSPSEVKVVLENDDLTDEDVLPGFRISLRTLFDDTAAAK
ncbi:MAG: Uma2 family endonuclease [Pirellulales bacterium]